MTCFEDALSNIMPIDWLDPYGRTPFANNAEMSVDITIVETDDGIRATSVKNPPRSGSSRLMDAIKNALGVDFSEIGPQNGSQRSVDLGKCNDENVLENKGKSKISDTMKPSSSEDSKQGSQPWSPEKSPEESSHQGATKTKDAKEKAPKF